MKLVEAQEGRRILDRLVGWETSPVLWRVFGRGQAASAGRVQSVAVRLVVRARAGAHGVPRRAVERPRGRARSRTTRRSAPRSSSSTARRVAEGRDFDPATGHSVAADRDGACVLDAAAAVRARRPPARRAVRGRVGRGGAVHRAAARRRSPRRRCSRSRAASSASAPPARCRSRSASTSADTSPTCEPTARTCRSRRSPRPARAIREQYGEEYLPAEPRAYRSKVKNAQEAHEAIRPAGDRIRTPRGGARRARRRRAAALRAGLDPHGRVPDVRRARQQDHAARRRDLDRERARDVPRPRARRTTSSAGGACTSKTSTRARSSRTKRGCPRSSRASASTCTELVAGRRTRRSRPPRYTEASLVKELEERGIGRPSTYAAVIETIQARNYVWRKGTALVPAWTAFAVTNLLERHFGHLVDYGFTATMEEALDVDRARRGRSREVAAHLLLRERAARVCASSCPTEQLATVDPRGVSTIPIGTDDTGHELVVRVGRYGPYVQREESETASLPPDIAPDELTSSSRSSSSRSRRPGPKSLGTDPETGLAGVRAHRPLRAVRAARRAGRGHEEEAEALVVVREPDARDGHARRGAAAAVAAAFARRRRRRSRDRSRRRAGSART